MTLLQHIIEKLKYWFVNVSTLNYFHVSHDDRGQPICACIYICMPRSCAVFLAAVWTFLLPSIKRTGDKCNEPSTKRRHCHRHTHTHTQRKRSLHTRRSLYIVTDQFDYGLHDTKGHVFFSLTHLVVSPRGDFGLLCVSGWCFFFCVLFETHINERTIIFKLWIADNIIFWYDCAFWRH